MCYSIIYGAQFLKADKNGETVYFPIVLIGDNNVYDWSGNGRQRRARSFTNLTHYTGGKPFATAETILNSVDQTRIQIIDRNKEDQKNYDNLISVYSDSSYGWFASISLYGKHTSNTSFNNFRNVFVKGIKNALTIEELLNAGIRISIATSYYSTKKLNELGLDQFEIYPKTTQELLQTIAEKEKYLAGSGIGFYVTLRGNEEILKDLKPKKAPKAPKQQKEVNEYFVILFENGYYFNKLTSRKLHFTYPNTVCKKFATKKQAQKVIDRINVRSFNTKVKEIETVITEQPILI